MPQNNPPQDLRKLLASLQQDLARAEAAYASAQQITKPIKEVNGITNSIIREISDLIEQQGRPVEIRYEINEIDEAAHKLVAKIYALEDIFEESVKNLRSNIEDVEYDIENGEDEPWTVRESSLAEQHMNKLRNKILYTEQLLAYKKLKSNK
jgi:hypothetical protein